MQLSLLDIKSVVIIFRFWYLYFLNAYTCKNVSEIIPFAMAITNAKVFAF